jgi:hypothetical protein
MAAVMSPIAVPIPAMRIVVVMTAAVMTRIVVTNLIAMLAPAIVIAVVMVVIIIAALVVTMTIVRQFCQCHAQQGPSDRVFHASIVIGPRCTRGKQQAQRRCDEKRFRNHDALR